MGSSHIQDILHSTNLDLVLLEHIHKFHTQGYIHNIHHSTGFVQPEAGNLTDEYPASKKVTINDKNRRR